MYTQNLQDESTVKEVIWSYSPNSEFNNKFMGQLRENPYKKYNKQFAWKFTTTSHSKGVVDGVGGNVKSTARRGVKIVATLLMQQKI